MSYPSLQQKKILWWAITGLCLVILGATLAGCLWILGKVLGFLQPVLVPLAVAGITAYLLDPLVSFLQKKGLSRLRSVIAVFTTFFLVFTLLASLIIPPIAKELSQTLQDKEKITHKIEKSIAKLNKSPWMTPLISYACHPVSPHTGIELSTPPKEEGLSSTTQPRWQYLLSKHSGTIAKTLSTSLSASSSKLLSLFGLCLGFLMAPIYLYYFLKESSGIKEHWHDYVPLRASRLKSELVACLQSINHYLIAFFRGQMLVAFFDGFLVGLSLTIFGLPYGIVIGLCLAILGMIPYIGNILCLIPACCIAFVHFSAPSNQFFLGSNPWVYVLCIMGIFIVVQQIDSFFLAPRIVGDSVGLHPMTVIFSMLFWSLLLGGFIGTLLAVPLTASLKVLFERYIWLPQITPVLSTKNQSKP